MSDSVNNTLVHEGTKFHSGRYPWGSGENPQRNKSFRQHVKELRKSGMSDKDIAKGFGMSINEMRANISLEFAQEQSDNISMARRLAEKGYSKTAIGEKMGRNESVIRSWLEPDKVEKANITESTINMLKDQVAQKKFLDVGVGTEVQVGVSRTRLLNAVNVMKQEGYEVISVQVDQQGTGKKTTIKVLAPEGTTYKDIVTNKEQISTVSDWSEDGGRTYKGLVPPASIDSNRIQVRFKEDGGADRDGVIQLRRGVKDMDLGDAKYAQVRILVDGEYYMKGMAVYADDLPNGVDAIYNSNKSKAKTTKHEALKDVEADPNDPFGASVRQKFYIDDDGVERVSALNIVGFPTKPGSGEQGAWSEWSNTLSSQFLSKQDPKLAEQQLTLSYDIQKAHFDEIMSVSHPTIRQRMLDDFSDDCDAKAVDLKAAAMPRQSSNVILPITSLKPGEAYAPSYPDGTELVLIRHPHGGIFELPVVTNNTRNKEGERTIGKKAVDAIGIHPKTAEQLSGADFDGDTVIAFPVTKQIKRSPQLEALKDFDPKIAYPPVEGMKVMTKANKQMEMGKVSNLITDMTIKGADESEIARAVKHSMVVIDSEKHKLNYTQSYKDNGIAALKAQYQGGTEAKPKGASTLISRSKSEIRIDPRKPVTKKDIENDPSLANTVRKADYSIDKATGQKVWVTHPSTFEKRTKTIDKDGNEVVKVKTVARTEKSTQMYETSDAFTLSSGSVMEGVYANYANSMKRLGDAARKESANIVPPKQSPSARVAYADEVASLRAKLTRAVSNKPMERQAQLLAGAIFNMKKDANPEMTKQEVKRERAKALDVARKRVGAEKEKIQITSKEWEAIQSGAISHTMLTAILNNTDPDSVKSLATPRTKTGLPPGKEARAKEMFKRGYTIADVAMHLGVSQSLLTGLGD